MNKVWAAMLITVAVLMAMPLAHAEGEVARSIITTEVVDREPVNDLDVVPLTNDTVLFFTELRDMKGQTVMHRWMRGDEQIAEVSFDVGGPRWRVWSSKKMMPDWAGTWTVQVVDTAGNVVAEKSFTYGMAEDSATGTTEESPMGEEAPPTPEEMPATEPAPESAPVDEEGSADTTE